MGKEKGKGGPPKGQGGKSGLHANLFHNSRPRSMVVSRNHNIYNNKPKQGRNVANQGNRIVGLIQANLNKTHEVKKKNPPERLAVMPPKKVLH